MTDTIELSPTSTPGLPDIITFDVLKTLPIWVAWQTQLRKAGDQKPSKIPYAPGGPDSRKAKANDPSTWGTRAAAEARASRLPKPFGAGGVGIEFAPLDAGRTIAGIDLDSCRDPDTGEIAPWARQVIDLLNSYAEISPSNRGIKIYCLFATADLVTLRAALGTTVEGKPKHSVLWARRAEGDHPPAIELHLSNRYFAVTDNILSGCTHELRLVPTVDLLRLIQVDGPAFVGVEPNSSTETDDDADAAIKAQQRGPKRTTIGNLDRSRSRAAFAIGVQVRRSGGSYQAMCEAIREHPETADWYREKGAGNGDRELLRIWEKGTPPPNWLQNAQMDRDGDPRANLANIMRAMRAAPELFDLVAYDGMLRAPLLMRPVPSKLIQADSNFRPRPVRDTDVAAVQEWLQLNGLEKVSKDAVHQSIDLQSMEREFHPVRGWLNGLRWDEKPRLEHWLSTYLGAEHTTYTHGIGTMFLIAMVARVQRPGCKADYLLVLEGPQGARKSTACAILGGDWFSDQLPDLRSGGKDVSQHLNGKWLIEVAEMSAMDKADSNALKSFVTRAEEKYRPSYGRRDVIEPRQCLFVGTTNKAAYLRDETGGRRSWPVKIGIIDIDALKRDRDQLFAEAMHWFLKGRRWWPSDKFEQEHITPQQEQRYEADAWEDKIGQYLSNRHKVTVIEVANLALMLDTPKLGTAEQRRIGAALERLGWQRGARTTTERPWIRCSA